MRRKGRGAKEEDEQRRQQRLQRRSTPSPGHLRRQLDAKFAQHAVQVGAREQQRLAAQPHVPTGCREKAVGLVIHGSLLRAPREWRRQGLRESDGSGSDRTDVAFSLPASASCSSSLPRHSSYSPVSTA
eukprot:9381320-Pyramimonas_sp.AAC.1